MGLVKRAICYTTSLAVALSCVLPPLAFANPQGGTVSAGQATISGSGTTLDVNQSSNKVVIDWRGFDIAPGEVTQFYQPSSNAIALNRVNSNNASQINGTLTANGNIIIINQNGVVFGSGAKVDVNGLVATTANISNDAFMNATGPLTFDQPGNPNASIINNGTITAAQAGLVGLVAPNVINNGVITAKLGKIQLASGDTATVDMYGDGLMEVAVSDQVKSQLVANTGVIQADGGTIALTAAAGNNIINSLITNSGVLQAQSVSQQNGEILIYAEGSNAVPGNVAANKGQAAGTSTVVVSGTLDASGYGPGQTGGTIQILGDNVGVLAGAVIDASGDTGGGNIKIGGDFHGAGNTPTAEATVVQSGATINANAITSGNGGNVTVWSDNYTNFAGNIEAKGGAQSGNGGFVETSGKINLQMNGNVDASASKGAAGNWLMDPEDVTISTGADSDITGSPSFVPGNSQATAVLNTTDIVTALNNGTAVTVTTGGDAQSGPNGGSITVSNAISATTGSGGITGALTLSSYKDIIISAAITLGGGAVTGGALTLRADNHANSAGAIAVNANITTNGGNITMGGGLGSITAGTLNANGTINAAATGFAVGDAYQSHGIYVNGTINAGTGAIIANGQGYNNAGAGSNSGVEVWNSGLLQTTTGNMYISGNGSAGTGTGNDKDNGVYTNSGTMITTASGAISITGVATDGLSYGVKDAGGGYGITSTGSGAVGDIRIYASSTGSTTANGVTASSVDANIIDRGVASSSGTGMQVILSSTGAGNITAYGTGNAGIYCSSNCYNVVTGSLNITGIGGGSDGVFINGGNFALSTGSAPITITGTGTTGIYNGIAGAVIGGASDTGAITLIADSINLSQSTNIQTTANITSKEYTAGTAIGIGTNATYSSGLHWTDTQLGYLNGGSYTFGDTSAGALDINTGSSIANKNLTFISNGTIYLDKSGDTSPTALTDSGSSNTTLTMQAGTDIVTSGAITASGTGALNVLMDADYAVGGGAIKIGGAITSNGGNITLGGGTGTISAGSGYAVGDSTYATGVLINGVTVATGGGNIIVNGQGYSTTGNSNLGVEVTGASASPPPARATSRSMAPARARPIAAAITA